MRRPHPSPRSVTKLARIGVSIDHDDAVFLPWVVGIAYRAEERAVCGQGRRHAVPDEDCSCGFYAAYNVNTLLDLLEPRLEDLAGAALLDAEFGGLEFAGPHGVRAAQQRVLGAGLFRWCRACTVQDRIPDGPPALYTPLSGSRPTGRRVLQILCDHHAAEATDARGLSLADLSGLLRTEVGWAPASLHDALLTQHERQLFAFSERAPLLADRRVGELRMGHRAFCSPEAVRFDASSKTVRVDLDARAPQRPQHRPFVVLKRTVELTWELRLPAEYAEQLDSTWTTGAHRVVPEREAEVTRIRGLHRLPLLSSLLELRSLRAHHPQP